MLAQIHKQRRKIASVLLLAAATLMVSCATQKDVALVKDPDAKPEGAMPWNKQEKWETGGQFANFSDRR
jgi:Spy/CpxP family protein refolding chaperone